MVCAYGDVQAVRGITLDVEAGEFFTLLGPSGCGKSTTLRAIGGFTRPSGGRIALDGQDVTATPPARRSTNYVFQNYALFPHLTVQDNVEYGLRRRKVPAGERRQRAEEELRRVGMLELRGRRPAQLSGGQQQRVALARALANRPRVLLLDEPLSALDFTMRKQLREELKTIQRDVGTTSVFVTHDQDEALSMSDRIAVMNDGLVEQVGTPEEIYARPATLFVARFVGSTNLLPGRIIGAGPDSRTVSLDLGARVEVRGAASGAVGDRCHLMVRPAAVTVTDTGPDDGSGRPAVAAHLEHATYVGDHYELRYRHTDGTGLSAHVRALPAVDGPVHHLTWEPGAAHLILAAEAAGTPRPGGTSPGPSTPAGGAVDAPHTTTEKRP
ncbi:ABC transporter ATP-binding protein [Streptomyces sp. NPDC058045]|uniref:ABC transporter ATP-binding protein n=1 Tax=Streptomyces sp. NPDC058045 TaxID=3346311 RepID=UPI0036E5C045